MGLVFKVCIPHTFHQGFDYFADAEEPCIGARVWVPFRKQIRLGIVIGKSKCETSEQNLKAIHQIIDSSALLNRELLALCQWVSEYYHSPLSEVITLALPKKYREGKDFIKPASRFYTLATSAEQAHARLSARAYRQHELVDFLSQSKEGVPRHAILKAGFTDAQINALENASLLKTWLKSTALLEEATKQQPSLHLNSEQEFAVNTVLQELDAYKAYLLQGVTGSGKTEVYLQVIEQVLRLGRQVLVLVPEIGLTPQLLARFRHRIHEPIAVIHSNLNDTERQAAWHAARTGEAKLIIGTRSAVFAPMQALGLIVVDEEHDASFKQMEGVRYSARDTALFRAHKAKIPIILGSATPSLESLQNCASGKYTLLKLRHKALNDKPLRYHVIDIRNQLLDHGLANPTLHIIDKHLQQDNQVLVFINRRGFAPVLLCHQCGWMVDCSACDTHLTLHRSLGKLICHHCGLINPIPMRCRTCQGQELIPVGAGTQRIHEFLSRQFPKAAILRFDRDEVRKKATLNRYLEDICHGKAQLIVGTQMLAKGHHFPRLTLVVILDADNGFYNQDFRALERLGQLLTQVSGRAGRAEYPGEVAIQTHLPKHPSLLLLLQNGYEAFAESLLAARRHAALPPFQFLALIRAQSKNQEGALVFLHTLKEFLLKQNVEILGPAPAPLAKKAHQYRMQLLLKAPSRKELQSALTQLGGLPTIKKITKGVRWNVDVDPVDLS
ncbi:primosomal protein N' [Legionella londiniensis]|uniref:Replication restart protein PriA n=1 Tax=Legionella londiniensis TaxID=45068 RepID=A0A0W0VHA1_9GAMM|nr:primosomal protein N' [Legionella londiniensis]KTD19541.1 Primosomal protein N' (replication factor Y) [Legionella londiniensis]STX92238.1 Primosomal protein N' (replication factor Y) [Legionella londiniensis]